MPQCPIECAVKDPCIQCHRVSVLIGSNYCPLCTSPQDGKRLSANTLDHKDCAGRKLLLALGDSIFEIDQKFVHHVQGEIMDKLGNSMENDPTELLSIRDELVQLRILKKGFESTSKIMKIKSSVNQRIYLIYLSFL